MFITCFYHRWCIPKFFCLIFFEVNLLLIFSRMTYRCHVCNLYICSTASCLIRSFLFEFDRHLFIVFILTVIHNNKCPLMNRMLFQGSFFYDTYKYFSISICCALNFRSRDSHFVENS